MSCGYQGKHFGAPYEDATCIDGHLWDLDSGDGDGMLDSGGDIPCPACNTLEYLDYGDVRPSGNSRQRRKEYRRLVRKIQGWAIPLQLPRAA